MLYNDIGGFMKFLPNMYKESVMDIPYSKLKKMGIKCIIFDLDNTLALLDEVDPPKRVIDLIKKLEKDFKVFIITNSKGRRAKPYKEVLNIEIISMAMKPFTKGLREISKKYGYKKSEMVMIGDQLVTDILSGKNYNIYTIFVDPLGVKDLKITYFNRFIEKNILKRYKKKGVFERGKYYE